MSVQDQIATDVARVKIHRCPLRSESNGPPSKRNLSQRANSRYSIWESSQLCLETQPTGDNFERFTGHVQVIYRGSLIFIAARIPQVTTSSGPSRLLKKEVAVWLIE